MDAVPASVGRMPAPQGPGRCPHGGPGESGVPSTLIRGSAEEREAGAYNITAALFFALGRVALSGTADEGQHQGSHPSAAFCSHRTPPASRNRPGSPGSRQTADLCSNVKASGSACAGGVGPTPGARLIRLPAACKNREVAIPLAYRSTFWLAGRMREQRIRNSTANL